jgi:nucleoside-diphosphate-sugar epimerase
MDHIIFGGSGFIASHLVNYLRLMVRSTLGSVNLFDINMQGGAVTFCDVRSDIEFTNTKIGSTIFNLAAVHTTPGHADDEYFETNMLGAQNVTFFARENNINTIVFTSSIAPYGASEDLKSEDTLPTPNTPYGISKLVAEHIHRTWQAEDPINRKLIIVRPGVVFGKGEAGNFTRLYSAMKKGYFFYPGRKDTQ